MAHVRQDTLVATIGYWGKHLHPYLKRLKAKCERKAAQKLIRKELNDLTRGNHEANSYNHRQK
jgi:hypothetical protein